MSDIRIIGNSLLREEIYVVKIRGMQVFVMPKKGFRRKYAEIFVRYGSNDNLFIPVGLEKAQEMPPGIAHFLEHKMFEKPVGDMFSAFGSIGASVNAYTSNNYTSYLYWTLENYEKALELLFEVVFNPYFTEKSVAKEQGIIAQEIRMYNDQPGSRLFRETMENLYLQHPLRYDVAGTESSIKEINADLLYRCYENFYQASNMSLFLAGDFEIGPLVKFVEKLLDKYDQTDLDVPERVRPDEPEQVGMDRIVNFPVPTPLLQIGWKDIPSAMEGAALIEAEISASMLLDVMFGKSSTFFTRVYEKGLVDDWRYSYEAWPDYAYAILTAQSKDPGRLAEMIWSEIDHYFSEGIDEKDFIRLKKAALGRYVSLFDSFDVVGDTQVHLWDIGEDVFSYGDILANISAGTVEEKIGSFRRDRSVRVILADGAGTLNRKGEKPSGNENKVLHP